MPIQTYELGPGKLILDDGAFDVSGQVRNCRIDPTETVNTREAIPVLSGEEIAKSEQAEFSFVLAGTMLQSLVADGVVDWSWANAGQPKTFVFVPNNTVDRAVAGTCYPVPLTLGGDVFGTQAPVNDPPAADFSWRCQGTPIFGVYDPVTGEVEEDV